MKRKKNSEFIEIERAKLRDKQTAKLEKAKHKFEERKNTTTVDLKALHQKLHISASQLKTYRNCPRLHWLQKVGKVPSQKPKLGAERGKKLHNLVEQFLSTKPTSENETFEDFLLANDLWEHDLRHGLRSAHMNRELVELRNLAHESSSQIDILVEQGFTLTFVYLGYIDLIVLDRRNGELNVTIHDHKFMSNKRSVMTEEEARNDYQTLIYAKSLITYFQ